VGSSPSDWEDTVRKAVGTVSESLRDVRIAEVEEFDVMLDDHGKVAAFRSKLSLSFKYEK
jgi:flavin-binding protein dodecin